MYDSGIPSEQTPVAPANIGCRISDSPTKMALTRGLKSPDIFMKFGCRSRRRKSGRGDVSGDAQRVIEKSVWNVRTDAIVDPTIFVDVGQDGGGDCPALKSSIRFAFPTRWFVHRGESFASGGETLGPGGIFHLKNAIGTGGAGL